MKIEFEMFGSDALPTAFSVPFAQGAVNRLDNVEITSGGARPAQQWKVLSRWPDASVRWAQVVARLKGAPTLSFPVASHSQSAAFAVQEREQSLEIFSDHVSLSLNRSTGRVLLSSGKRQLSFLLSELTTSDGERLSPLVERVEVTENGPVQAVVRVQGWHGKKMGEGLFRFDLFLKLYAGLPVVEIDHALGVVAQDGKDRPEMFSFQSAYIPVRLMGESAVAGAEADASSRSYALKPGERLFQFEDEKVELSAEGTSQVEVARAGGTMVVETTRGRAFVAVEDFWQQYPKSFALAKDGFDIGLFPELKVNGGNPYDSRDGEHIWYYYLKGGRYEMRQGVEKSHRILLGWLDDELVNAKAVAAWLEGPVVMPSLDYLIATDAEGGMVPPNSGGWLDLWDQAMITGARSYDRQQKENRWYGLMNWGDWHGERLHNWGNHEYDLPATYFRQALRFRDPQMFREAIRGSRHRMNIDVVNHHNDASQVGRNWIHSVGHTGGYYAPGTLKIPNYNESDAAFHEGKSTSGHTRIIGVYLNYLLTGDPRALEVGRKMTDHLLQMRVVTDDKFVWSTAREPGWALVNLAAAYRATGDVKYLEAGNRVADIVMKHADGKGVWHKRLTGGQRNSPGSVPELGELSFPTAFQAAGMIELYKLTGREAIRDNVIATADYIVNRLYRPEHKAFMHSPSLIRKQTPRAGGIAGTNLRYILAYAYDLSGDPKYLDVVKDTFTTTVNQREWFGAKENPDDPSPQSLGGSFFFLNEDQAVMNKILGSWLRHSGGAESKEQHP